MMTVLLRRLLGPLFIVVVAMVALGAAPWRGETVGPLDLLVAGEGWGKLETHQVRHMARSDALTWQLPQWHWAKERLAEGEMPIWNWTRGGGMPGFFDLSTAMATPSFAIYALLDNEAVGFYCAILLRLLIAGFGMYLLLRSEVDELSATFGGITFMLSGFITAWLYWPHTSTVMWLPWLLWALFGVLRSWQQPDFAPKRLGWWFALVAITWLMAVGGFPAVAAYCFYAAGLAFLVWGLANRLSISSWARVSLATGPALLSGLLLAAPWASGLYDVLSHVDTSERTFGAPVAMANMLKTLLPHQAWTHLDVEQTRYVGTTGLAAALVGLFALGFNSASRTPLLWAGVVLFIVSALFVGGWVPRGWVTHIPALNNSSWTRLASVMGFSLALMAAFGIAVLKQRFSERAPRQVMVALLILTTLQTVEQIDFFRQFNGPVEASNFYPSTDAIAHIQTSQQPLQGTVADFSFWFGGTVNYFGLHEWMSHGFKTAAERRVMNQFGDDLFASLTSLRIEFSQFDMNSPLLNALGIRFLVGRVRGESIGYSTFGISGHHPAPALPFSAWSQQISLNQPITLSGVELHLATYDAPHAPAPVQMKLLANGKLLRTGTLPASGVSNNQWRYFEFETPVKVEGEIQLEVALVNPTTKGLLTAWSGLATEQASLAIDDVPGDLSLKFNLVTTVPDNMQLHRFSRGMGVLENLDVTSNAYWIPALDALPETISYNSETVAKIRNNTQLQVSYTGSKPGWVVVPMRIFPGWQAYLDEQPVAVDTYLDMMPAFKVSGPSVLNYRYEPANLYLAFWIAGLTALALIALLLRRAFGRLGVSRAEA